MGRRYATAGSLTSAAATTRMTLISTTAIRPRLYDILLSQTSAAPADNENEYQVQRITTTGTTTAITVAPLDIQDPAAAGTSGINATIEPTYTANTVLLRFSHNMRAVFRWIAGPLGELVLPATASAGVGLLFNASNSAFNDVGTMHWEE